MTLTSGVADLKIYIQRTFFVTITSVW
jgi:hypothetical protein